MVRSRKPLATDYDEAWLRRTGGTPDNPDGGGPVELAWRIWQLGETTSWGDEPAMQLIWSSSDGHWWLESYGPDGTTLALVELGPRQTRERVLAMFDALNVNTEA